MLFVLFNKFLGGRLYGVRFFGPHRVVWNQVQLCTMFPALAPASVLGGGDEPGGQAIWLAQRIKMSQQGQPYSLEYILRFRFRHAITERDGVYQALVSLDQGVPRLLLAFAAGGD